jgi:hypothetical protein
MNQSKETQMLYLFFLVGCGLKKETAQPDPEPVELSVETPDEASGVKKPDKVLALTEEQLRMKREGRDKCVAECVQSRQMEAMSIEAITAGCEQSCDGQHLLLQKETDSRPEDSEEKESPAPKK